MLNLSHRTMLGFQIRGNLLPFVPCLLSPPSPALRLPESQAGCSWYVLTLRGHREMESHSQYALSVSTGGRTLTIGPQRPETRRGEAHRNREDLHTPPPPPQKGATEELPSPISFARRQLSLSLSLGGDTTWTDHPAVDSRDLVCS